MWQEGTRAMESVSEVVGSLLEATKPTAELSRTGLDVKGAPQEPSRKPSLIITPSSFLSPLPLDELLENARSKLKKAVNTSRETPQGGGRAERPLRTNPPWAFSPSGAAFPQIHSLGGLPRRLQAQITIYRHYRKISCQSSAEKESTTGLPQDNLLLCLFLPSVQHQKGARHSSTAISHHQSTWVPILAPRRCSCTEPRRSARGCPYCTSSA